MAEQDQAAQPQQPRGVTLNVREHDLKVSYANTCLLTNTREEFLLDFGVAVPVQGAEQPQINMLVSNRIIMNLPAAKRLAIALSQAIQRYESAFGLIPIEQRPPDTP